MGTFFPKLAVPIVRGYPRGAYLNATRYFPSSWVSEYTGLLDVYYGAWASTTPAPKTPEELAAALLALPKAKGSFSVLSIGPTTTLPLMFDRYPALLERTEYVLNDLGSIAPHQIYPGARRTRRAAPGAGTAMGWAVGVARRGSRAGRARHGACGATTRSRPQPRAASA
jgi:hypothetical protein